MYVRNVAHKEGCVNESTTFVVSLTVTGKVAEWIVLGEVAAPDRRPDFGAHDRLERTGDALVTSVHAIDADTRDIELGAEGMRAGTREEQRGESTGRTDSEKFLVHYLSL